MSVPTFVPTSDSDHHYILDMSWVAINLCLSAVWRGVPTSVPTFSKCGKAERSGDCDNSTKRQSI